MNELTGTYNIPSWNEATTYTISRDKEQMERGIHPVRIRAGLPDYPDEFYLQSGVDDMRKAFHSAIPVYNLPSTFSEKLWLWPIKHSELKRNSRLTQNPGWTMYD